MLGTFITFGAVGLVGTVVHYATLVALVEGATVPPTWATVVGAIVGAAVNYILNYRVTFRSTAAHRVSLLRFACVALLGVVVSAALVAMAEALGVAYLLGQIVATGVVLVLGFALNRYWTFRERS